jgi:hypothetical protein
MSRLSNTVRTKKERAAMDQRLIIKESVGKGLGVFAIVKIMKGTIVATYPATVGEDEFSDYNLSDAHGGFFTGVAWSGPVPSNPLPLQSPIAHMFNDATTLPQYAVWPGLTTFLKDYRAYEMESTSLNNVERIGDTLRFRAIRDILSGEEIFYRYGQLYWLQKYMGVTGKPYATLMNAILQSLAQSPPHMRCILDIGYPIARARWAILDGLTGLSKDPRLSPELGNRLRLQATMLMDFLEAEGTALRVTSLQDIQRAYEEAVNAADTFLCN